mgnify:CR=1 FL=1
MKINLSVILFLFFFSFTTLAQERKVVKLSFEECLEIALENNLQLKQSELNQKSQKIGLLQSQLSQLPSINLSGNYGNNWGRSVDPTTNQFTTTESYYTGISGFTQFQLFNGFQKRNTIKKSKNDLEKSTYDLEKAKNDVRLNVVNLFLNVLFSLEQVSNALNQLESTKEQLTRIIKLVDAGSLPITNKLNLEAQFASDELALVQQENNYKLSILRLKQIMLIDSSEEIEIIKPEIDINPNVFIGSNPLDIYNTSLGILPEVKSLELSMKSSDYDLKISRSGRYPSININSSLSTNYSSFADRQRDFYNGFESKTIPIGFLTNDPSQIVSTSTSVPVVTGSDDNFTITEQWKDYLSKQLTISLSIPLFNGFQVSSNIQRSKVNKRLTELNVLESKNQLRQSIETAYNDALAASKTFIASKKQVEALEESFRVVKTQYNLGVVNFTDYQVSNNNLVRAKSDMLRSKYDYIVKLKILDFYQGKPLIF